MNHVFVHRGEVWANMKLRAGEAQIMREFGQVSWSAANEDSNLLDGHWQPAHNVAHSFRRYVSRTFLIKYEPQRIRARFYRRERVFEIRDSANLDPSHEAVNLAYLLKQYLRLAFASREQYLECLSRRLRFH